MVVAKEKPRAMASPKSSPVLESRSIPPYSASMERPHRPSSADFSRRPTITSMSLEASREAAFSMPIPWISFMQKSFTMSRIINCSSFHSSGTNMLL